MRAAFAVGLAALLLLAGCIGLKSDRPREPYKPIFATGPADPSAARGTLKGDYDWARSASELHEAEARWEQFRNSHEPRAADYQDSFEKRHVEAAKYELMRAYYLLGQREKGDELLRQLDPLEIR